MEKEQNIERTKQTKHYVAFLDLLGYKDFFSNNKDNTEQFLDTLLKVLEETKEEVKNETAMVKTVETDFTPEIKLFSDNILIFLKCKKENKDNIVPYLLFLKLLGRIQLKFLTKYKLFLRGGVAKGLFFSNELLVFGEALIKSYEMEQRANFPKIMLDTKDVKELIQFINSDETTHASVPKNLLRKSFSSTVCKDGDNTYFINYFNVNQFFLDDGCKINPINIFAYTPSESIKSNSTYEPIGLSENLKFQKAILKEKMSEFGVYSNIKESELNAKNIDTRRKIQMKYMWSIDYHNKICELTGHKEHIVACKITTDNLTHLPKVEVIENDE